jgi:hypothetical protein
MPTFVLAVLCAAVMSQPALAFNAAAAKKLEPCKIPGHENCAIDESSLAPIEEEEGVLSQRLTPPPATGDPSGVDLSVILNLAKEIWAIIEKNKPVVDIKTDYAVALPQGITSWGQLSGWKAPEGKVYGFYAKNKFGQRTVNVRYLVTRMWGGAYKGKGKYLTGVTIEPLTVDVAWGYKFSMKATAPSEAVGNIGTDEEPLAGLRMKVLWTIETPVKSSTGQSVYWFQGDGVFRQEGSPFPAAVARGAARAWGQAQALRIP